jgi:plasmid stabilization system protein ParE
VRRQVRWSREALDDLKYQIDYIAADNPAAAKRVAARIRSAGASLGKAATGRRGRIVGTYEKVVSGLPYIIAYSIAHRPGGGEVVMILRVIHDARHWPPGEWPR